MCSSSFRAVSAILLCCVLATSGAAQSPLRPQFRSNVELIQFQVNVADEEGGFVPGLVTQDFEVLVDGEPRELVLAYEVNRAPQDTVRNMGGGPLPYSSLPAAAWRQWVMLFDAAFNSPRGVLEARKAALAFVDESVLPEDLVSVVTYNVVEGIRTIVPLTRDRVQIRAAIDGLGLTQATRNIDRAGFIADLIRDELASSDGSGQRAEAAATIAELAELVEQSEFRQYTDFVARYAQQLQQLGELMQVIRGRKHVLFFTEGFEDRVLVGKSLNELAADTNLIQADPGMGLASTTSEDRFGSADVRAAIDAAVTDLRQADALLHMIDVSGLAGGRDRGSSPGRFQPSLLGERTRSGRNSLTVWAHGTGGSIVWNTNELARGLREIERATRDYYVLAVPRRPGDPDSFEIDTRVRREGVVVTSAASRLTVPGSFETMSPMQRQAQLAEFISKGLVDSSLAFATAVTPFVGKNDISRVAVIVEVPWEQLEALAEAGDDDNVDLEILSYVLNSSDTMLDLADGQVSIDLARLRRSNGAGLPFRHYNLMWSGPGLNRVRTIVRDAEIGLISARTDELAVPLRSRAGLFIDGPVAIDWQHPGLLLRGFDADNPPEHKLNGPVAFPFALGELELTPAALATAAPGDVVQFYVQLHGLRANPYTRQPNWQLEITLLDPMGNPITVERARVIEQRRDPTTGGIQVLAGLELPGALSPSFHTIRVTIHDVVAGTQATAELPVWVQGSAA